MDIPKYPVVLVHGLAVKNFPFLNAFGSIPRFLREKGLKIYVTNHDSVGTITGNARQLQKEIEAICQTENCEKVNLIAHSKGGLDARYMISALSMHPKVASLTTLSTPHHGSRLSATILRLPKWILHSLGFLIDRFFRLFGDREPNILAAARELTDSAMEQFNVSVPNHPAVYYQSYSSQASKENAFLVYIPYQVSRYCEQDETDGLVSVRSSRWGDYQGHINGDLNHVQIISFTGSKRKRQAVAEFYLHIITQLRNKGF